MKLSRFLRKCFTDPAAAWKSVKLLGRSVYGEFYWTLKPNTPLLHNLQNGGVLLLEPGHSFTYCFYPGVDSYEPDVRLALQHLLKPGDTFIDCGANVGYFSVLAAQLVKKTGKIVSVEANPTTYSLLERNLSANRVGIPVHCALTTASGEVELFMPIEGGDVYSSLSSGGLLQGQSTKSFKVKGQALDEVIDELDLLRVDVVKVDVEGAELEVLRSGDRLLSKFRPTIVMEYSTVTWSGSGANPEKLQNLLNSHSYHIYLLDAQSQSLVPVTQDVWESRYVNLILVPEEKTSSTVEVSG
jgi:FkbM family methyltransferase